jgi:hypothetical protein
MVYRKTYLGQPKEELCVKLIDIKLMLVVLTAGTIACNTPARKLQVTRRSSLSGTDFYKQAAAMSWKQRDSFAILQFYAGNIPAFLLELRPVQTTFKDPVSGKTHKATFYVTPDYFSIGTDQDWARVPLTPMAATHIADRLRCFLPSRKMVDDIHRAAEIKLEPVPMFAFRDSTPTMWHHHLIIEGQRNRRGGLISGIKKDVVNTYKLNHYTERDRVAIYGWHKSDGKPIQPLYTGHVNRYVDYSHGIRLVSRNILVDGKWMDYKEVLKDPALKHLLCDEEICDWE